MSQGNPQSLSCADSSSTDPSLTLVKYGRRHLHTHPIPVFRMGVCDERSSSCRSDLDPKPSSNTRSQDLDGRVRKCGPSSGLFARSTMLVEHQEYPFTAHNSRPCRTPHVCLEDEVDTVAPLEPWITGTFEEQPNSPIAANRGPVLIRQTFAPWYTIAGRLDALPSQPSGGGIPMLCSALSEVAPSWVRQLEHPACATRRSAEVASRCLISQPPEAEDISTAGTRKSIGLASDRWVAAVCSVHRTGTIHRPRPGRQRLHLASVCPPSLLL